MEDYVGWDIDHIKVDGCGGFDIPHMNESYALIGQFLQASAKKHGRKVTMMLVLLLVLTLIVLTLSLRWCTTPRTWPSGSLGSSARWRRSETSGASSTTFRIPGRQWKGS